MKKLCIFGILFFSSVGVAYSQAKPEISVTAPTQVDRKSYLFQILMTIKNKDELKQAGLRPLWIISEDGVIRENNIIVEDGKMVILPTGEASKFTYRAVAKYDYEIRKPLKVVDKDGKPLAEAKVFIGDDKSPSKDVVVGIKTVESDWIVGEVNIVGGTPVPPTPNPIPPTPIPPDPTPTPTPTPPVFPPGEFGLAQANYEIAMSAVPADHRFKGPALADSFDKVAKQIATSQSKLAAGVGLAADDLKLDMKSIISEVKASNGTALGASAPAWEVWNSKFGDAVYELFTAKKLVTPAQFRTAFLETAQGLRQVK